MDDQYCYTIGERQREGEGRMKNGRERNGREEKTKESIVIFFFLSKEHKYKKRGNLN